MSYLFSEEIGPDTLTPWPPQVEAIAKVRARLAKSNAALVLHTMGVGKTVTAAEMIRSAALKGNRSLFLAHTGELLAQAANTIERVGIVPGIEKAGAHARACADPLCVVASVATMQGVRLASWPRDHFKLIIADECHHFVAPSFRAILDHFVGYKLVGFTATADRLDGEPVDSIFGAPADEFDLFDALTAPPPGPYLCPYEIVRGDIGIDLRDLSPGRRDYSADDLGQKIAPLAAEFARSIRKEVGDRPTIAFVPNVASATAFANALRKLGMDADWVSGDDPDRDYKIRRYRDGESQCLVNAMLLTEGFDARHTAAVALCRPTRSRAAFAQMFGRPLRLHPDKELALILDYDWITEQHDVKRPADLFAKQLGSDEAVSAANEIILEFPRMSIKDVVAEARKRASGKLSRREIDVTVRPGEVRYVRREEYRPFPGVTPPRRPVVPMRHDAPTDRQVAFLRSRGQDIAPHYTKRLAGALIGRIKAKEAADAVLAEREAS